MGKLMRIEFLKIRRRPRTWIMAVLVVVVTIAFALIIQQIMSPTNPNWKEETIKANQDLQKQIDEGKVPEETISAMRSEMAINTYNLEHDLPPSKGSAWKFLDSASELMTLISIFAVIIAGDTISSEFGWGTIKLLLIRPASRTKIMYAKYLTAVVMTVLFTLLLFVVAYVVGGIFFGFIGYDQPFAYLNPEGSVEVTTMWQHDVLDYSMELVTLLMYVTMAFMISAAFRSSAMSIAISLLLMLVGENLVQFMHKSFWAKYIMMANTNLLSHIEGPTLFEGTTMAFSIIVLAVYFLLFHWVAWYTFTKRDVAA